MECYPSKLTHLFCFFISLFFIGLIVFFWSPPLGSFHPLTFKIPLFLLFILFIFLALYHLFSFFRSGVRLIINSEGIQDKYYWKQIIVWEDIEKIGIDPQQRYLLCIQVRQAEKYLANLSLLKRLASRIMIQTSGPNFWINFFTIKTPLSKVWPYLKKNHPDKIKGEYWTLYEVKFDRDFIQSLKEGAAPQSIRWASLEKITFQNSGATFSDPGENLIFEGLGQSIQVPSEAVGFNKLLKELKIRFPNFDTLSMEEGPRHNRNTDIVCWKKD